MPDPFLGTEKTLGGEVTVKCSEMKENAQCLTAVTAASLANRRKCHSGRK